MRAAVGWLSSDPTGRSVDPRTPAFRRPGGFPSPAERRRALAAAVRSLAAHYDHRGPGLAIDLAGGTGYYLARTLDALPHRHGVCLDLSVPALRRAARAHRRAAALGADVWQPLPLAARSAAVVLSIFGPRNPAETSRILAPDGTLILAVPGAAHLGELTGPLGMIGIDQRKPRRLAEAYRGYATSEVIAVNHELKLDHADLTALVTMGPSARHITPQDLAARIRGLPSPVTVTVDLQIRASGFAIPLTREIGNNGP